MVDTLSKRHIRDSYDLIIIGGGYVGAWTAYFASKYCPDWHILLVDAATFGSGASRYAADLDFPNNRTEVHHQLSAQSRALFKATRKRIPDLPLVNCPAYLLGTQQHLTDYKMAHALSAPTSDKEEAIYLSGHRLKRPQEQYLLKDIAAQRASDKTLIPKLLAAASQRSSRLHFREGLRVTSIRSSSEGYELLFDQAIRKRGKRVVTAIGPWATQVDWLPSIQPAVRVKKVVAYAIDIAPKATDTVVYLLDDGAFLLPQQEQGRWLLSITSQEWDCPPQREALRFKEDERQLAIALLEKYLPDFVPYLKEGLIFCDAYPQGGHPFIKAVDGDDRHLFVGACAGSGFRLAPALAHQAVQRLMQQQATLIAQQITNNESL